MFNNKVLLITGGTGSFGNAVLERFLDSDIREIIIFSRDEKKQNDMRLKYNNKKIKFIIGDVRNFDSIYKATKGVDYIFHAAALKQVPSCEFFPYEAVKTNILGTQNVLDAGVDNNVKKIIVLSTDKAVFPINAMGMTKAIMEKLVVAKSRRLNGGETVLCCTRYGNVMGSRGSVIPLFINQIKNEVPITVTNQNMTRFLLSLDEAVDLVINAFKNGKQGDIWIKKAPAATVLDLAISLKELFESETPIKIIGIRHGEKIHETLLTSEEMSKATDEGDYYRIKCDNRSLNYDIDFINKLSNNNEGDYNSKNTKRLSIEEIKGKLLNLNYVKKELEKIRDREE